MKKIFLLLATVSIHLSSFSQNITYKNAWGEEVIGPNIEESIYNGVSRALDDILKALEEEEKRAILERKKMSLAERGRKVGISIPEYSLDDPLGRAAFEPIIAQRERAIYRERIKRERQIHAQRLRNSKVRLNPSKSKVVKKKVTKDGVNSSFLKNNNKSIKYHPKNSNTSKGKAKAKKSFYLLDENFRKTKYLVKNNEIFYVNFCSETSGDCRITILVKTDTGFYEKEGYTTKRMIEF